MVEPFAVSFNGNIIINDFEHTNKYVILSTVRRAIQKKEHTHTKTNTLYYADEMETKKMGKKTVAVKSIRKHTHIGWCDPSIFEKREKKRAREEINMPKAHEHLQYQ